MATSSAVCETAVSTITEQEAFEIGKEAFEYFYPLITMDVTRRVVCNVPPGVKPGMGPENTFAHMRAYPGVDFKEVVKPNFDTLYTVAWLNLAKEPLIVSTPDTHGRYYLLPMLDMWSDVFAVPGKRTSGTGAANWAVVAPGWDGTLPVNVSRIDAPTPYVWIIGRIQTNGPSDYDAVHLVQDGFTITPLSQWGKTLVPGAFKHDQTVDMSPPVDQVNNMPAKAYFTYAAALIKVNPPHASDWSQLARLKRIGIEVGKSLDWNGLAPEVQSALTRATTAGLNAMRAKQATLAHIVNGWQLNTDTMGVYGNYYMKRAIVALTGLGANQPEDAIYPMNLTDAEGNELKAGRKYLLRFRKDEIPPANAFWSLTMYDPDFAVPNPINRYAIGDRDALKFNTDGSLDIYIQPDSPGMDKESNWLPSPKQGNMNVTMRLYAPKAEAILGIWVPPAITPVK